MATTVIPPIVRAKLDELVRVRLKDEELERQHKASSAHLRMLEAEVYQLLADNGVSSMKVDGLGTFIRTERLYVHLARTSDPSDPSDEEHVSESARASLEAWARQTRDASGEPLIDVLFAFQPKMSTVKAVYKDRLENGEELPPGVESGYVKGITWRRDPTLKGSK